MHAVTEEDDLSKLEMRRKVFPKAEIIAIINLENMARQPCNPLRGGYCDGIVYQCCDPYRCTVAIFGDRCQ